MSKRTTFTTITPLPPGISRQTVISFLHDHTKLIDLNPLVKERHPIRPPSHAPPDELRCAWYSQTDHVSYLPGRVATGEVTYTSAFNNISNGVETHCYAPAGLDIRQRWTLNGSQTEGPEQPVEPGHKDAPTTGLYIREDVDLMCNRVMTAFVKKTLKDSHAELIERLKLKAQLANARAAIRSPINKKTITTSTATSNTTPGQKTSDTNNVSRGVAVNIVNKTAPADKDKSKNKNLAVYNWLNSSSSSSSSSSSRQHQQESDPSADSRNNYINIISPVSYTSPSYRTMVVSPPSPEYSPMAWAPLWTTLQPQPPSTLSTPSPLPSPILPLRLPSKPNEKEVKKQKPTIRLIPEPLHIPRTSVPVVIQTVLSPININLGPQQKAEEEKRRSLPPPRTPARRRKFSYDSTSSAENHLLLPVTGVVTTRTSCSSSPKDVSKNLPPPQHILSQSKEYHQQVVVVSMNNTSSQAQEQPQPQPQPKQKQKISPPPSPILQKLRRYMGTQFISFDPFEPHPDYPHMSPYMDMDGDGDDDAGNEERDCEVVEMVEMVDDDDEYEDVKVEDEDEDEDDNFNNEMVNEEIEIDDYYYFNGADRDRDHEDGGTISKLNLVSQDKFQISKDNNNNKDEENEEEEDIIMNDNDSGYADYVPPPPPTPTRTPPPPPVPVPPKGLLILEENQKIGATLSGPFVAAFDEFDICLP